MIYGTIVLSAGEDVYRRPLIKFEYSYSNYFLLSFTRLFLRDTVFQTRTDDPGRFTCIQSGGYTTPARLSSFRDVRVVHVCERHGCWEVITEYYPPSTSRRLVAGTRKRDDKRNKETNKTVRIITETTTHIVITTSHDIRLSRYYYQYYYYNYIPDRAPARCGRPRTMADVSDDVDFFSVSYPAAAAYCLAFSGTIHYTYHRRRGEPKTTAARDTFFVLIIILIQHVFDVLLPSSQHTSRYKSFVKKNPPRVLACFRHFYVFPTFTRPKTSDERRRRRNRWVTRAVHVDARLQVLQRSVRPVISRRSDQTGVRCNRERRYGHTEPAGKVIFSYAGPDV